MLSPRQLSSLTISAEVAEEDNIVVHAETKEDIQQKKEHVATMLRQLLRENAKQEDFNTATRFRDLNFADVVFSDVTVHVSSGLYLDEKGGWPALYFKAFEYLNPNNDIYKILEALFNSDNRDYTEPLAMRRDNLRMRGERRFTGAFEVVNETGLNLLESMLEKLLETTPEKRLERVLTLKNLSSQKKAEAFLAAPAPVAPPPPFPTLEQIDTYLSNQDKSNVKISLFGNSPKNGDNFTKGENPEKNKNNNLIF